MEKIFVGVGVSPFRFSACRAAHGVICMITFYSGKGKDNIIQNSLSSLYAMHASYFVGFGSINLVFSMSRR